MSDNFYIRGTQAYAKLKSRPISVIILDDCDELTPENEILCQNLLKTSSEKDSQPGS